MTVLLLSLILALAGCTGLILAGRGHWQGWAVGLAVQPVWAVFAVVTHGYGLLLTCVMYGTVYTRNLLAWRRSPKRVAEAKQAARAIFDDPAKPGREQSHGATWADGYEWALAHLDDEGVDNDRRRLARQS